MKINTTHYAIKQSTHHLITPID